MLVLIAGITGSLGQRLANVAKSRGLSVRGLGRSPDKLSPELSRYLESFVKSENYYDIPALEKAVAGVDAVICAYAPDPVMDLDAHLLLLRATERAKVKIFVASCWNNDWTKIKFGDFEHYDTHIAFERQVAMTSTISPVYIFTGLFADALFTPFGPGAFDANGGKPIMRYWGASNTIKWPWSTQDDAATWTIDILLHDNSVKNGNGGYFKLRSGENTIEELAAAYEKAFQVDVEVYKEGTIDDLEREVSRLRKEKGPSKHFEYLPFAFTLLGAKGLWEMTDVTVLDYLKEPDTLASYVEQQRQG